MIAPRSNVLWGLGLWVIPLNLGVILYPTYRTFFLWAQGFFFLVLLIDALISKRRGLEIQVTLPALSRFSLHRPASLKVVLHNPLSNPITAGLWLDFPGVLGALKDKIPFTLDGINQTISLQVPIEPIRRGLAKIRNYHLEFDSPLGFWRFYSKGKLNCEVKVFPNLLDPNSEFGSPENQIMAGAHIGRQVGKGWEFDKLREYIHGDDYHDIHWKATAKKGFPVTKVFQMENTQQVYAIVDISRFSSLPLKLGPKKMGPSPLEYYVQTSLRLGMAAERQGDYYGLMLYGEQPETFVRAGKGKAHYGHFRDALYNVQSKPGTPDYPELFAFLRKKLRKRSLLLFFSDLSDTALAESFYENIGVLSRQHLVSVNMLRAPGMQPVFGGEPVANPGDIYEKLHNHIYLQNQDRIGRSLRKNGIAFQAWDPIRFSPSSISQYLDAKKRQALA